MCYVKRMTKPETPGRRQTENARRTRTEAKWRRWADEMRAGGWTVIEPPKREEGQQTK